MSLSRILPLATLVAGGVVTKDQVAAQVSKVAEIPRVIAVQEEVNELGKMVYLDSLSNQLPTQPGFGDYARKNLKVQIGSQRDTSKDLWGNDYRIAITDREVVVASAGPDGVFGTQDDIYSGFTK